MNVVLGFGVRDFENAGRVAWEVYKACKDAPEKFDSISLDVLSLYASLKESGELFEEELAREQALPISRQRDLQTVLEECTKTLEDLKSIVNMYDDFNSDSKRSWEQSWGVAYLAGVESGLQSYVKSLDAFIRFVSSSLIPLLLTLRLSAWLNDLLIVRAKLQSRRKLPSCSKK
jgi:hypothetical protein